MSLLGNPLDTPFSWNTEMQQYIEALEKTIRQIGEGVTDRLSVEWSFSKLLTTSLNGRGVDGLYERIYTGRIIDSRGEVCEWITLDNVQVGGGGNDDFLTTANDIEIRNPSMPGHIHIERGLITLPIYIPYYAHHYYRSQDHIDGTIKLSLGNQVKFYVTDYILGAYGAHFLNFSYDTPESQQFKGQFSRSVAELNGAAAGEIVDHILIQVVGYDTEFIPEYNGELTLTLDLLSLSGNRTMTSFPKTLAIVDGVARLDLEWATGTDMNGFSEWLFEDTFKITYDVADIGTTFADIYIVATP
jgi:hypothetical protein